MRRASDASFWEVEMLHTFGLAAVVGTVCLVAAALYRGLEFGMAVFVH